MSPISGPQLLSARAALVIALIAVGMAVSANEADEETVWREDYAYTLGVQAYIFGFPYIYMSNLRWDWVTQPKPPGSVAPYAALNHFSHVRTLFDSSWRGGGSPNEDTLFSFAWVDVSKEPIILSHPDMGDRYFAFELASIDSDNFAYVGKRTTGGRAGSFAIVGPDWNGALPDGVNALPASRTSAVLLFGRTLIDGQEDMPAVHSLQDQFTLIPLSFWGSKDANLPETRDVWRPFDTNTDPLAEWKTMNRAMTENPPEARLAKLIELFAKVGVGPGQEIDKLDDATKRGLARAAVDGRKMLNDVTRSGQLAKHVNNWNIPPESFGRAGLADDFLLRASNQSLGGIIANDPAEAVYYYTFIDGAGQPFDGTKRYTIKFDPGRLPKVNAFWSLTMYDMTYNFTPNPIDRYSIGDRTKGLKLDSDDGLTIYIQSNSPGEDKESNWLPSTTTGQFYLIMRTYMPGREIVEQKWAPPSVMDTSH